MNRTDHILSGGSGQQLFYEVANPIAVLSIMIRDNSCFYLSEAGVSVFRVLESSLCAA